MRMAAILRSGSRPSSSARRNTIAKPDGPSLIEFRQGPTIWKYPKSGSLKMKAI